MAINKKLVGMNNNCVEDFQALKGTTHHCDTVSQTCTNVGAMNQCLRNGYEWDIDYCTCSGGCGPDGSCSPVLVDPSGNGFSLTSALNGVSFDINADGITEQIGWPAVGSDDAFLVLDRDNNGKIDDGSELFGNFTPQPTPPAGAEKNGFLALAEYDKSANGGNGDGWIGPNDSIYSQLRLWQDINHNGVSESSELKTLMELGLRRIDLDYRSSQRIDEFGNQFRYRARVKDAQGQQFSRWAWDVFFVSAR